MKTFKVNENLEIVCEFKNTRNGFKHEATLLKDGNEIDKTKINYLNRTWERFEFDSVVRKLLDKTKILTDQERTEFLDRISGKVREETDKQFKTIAIIAKMGEVIGQNRKESNDWKARMIKAGLLGKGLIMPNDWDQLTEDEKEKRLNKVIDELQN